MHTTSSHLIHYLRRLGLASEDPSPDSDLLERFVRSRDEAAFTALVARHGPMVFQVARRALGDVHAAEDAFQATFLVLARKAGSLTGHSSLPGFLHSVAVRVARKAIARRQRRTIESAVPDLRAVPDAHPDPLAELSVRELLALLDEEIQRLPERYRLPVILCGLEGMTREEAARRIGCTPGTVKGRLERGRARLQARLTRRGIALPAVLAGIGAGTTTTGALPAGLAAVTARGALLSLAGTTTGLSVQAVTLADQVAKAVTGAALKVCATVLAVGLVAVGAGAAAYQLAAEKQAEEKQANRSKEANYNRKPASKAAEPVHRDRFGDPLPPGAIARIGTVRLQQGFWISSLSYSPDGRMIASAGHDMTARFWEVATGREIRRFSHEKPVPLEGAVLTPDGRTLLTAGNDNQVYVWDLTTGKVKYCIRAGPHFAHHLAMSPDGMKVAWRSGETVQLWDWPMAKPLWQVNLAGNAMALSADGEQLACAGEGVNLIDVVTGKRTEFLNPFLNKYRAYSLSFASDGKVLATGREDNTVRLWEVATGRQLRQLDNKPGQRTVVAFAPRGKLLASAAWDGPVQLWDADSGKEVHRLQGRPDITTCLAFSPDGRTLARAGARGIVQLFDVASGKELFPLGPIPDVGSRAAFRADGKQVITANGWTAAARDSNYVAVWDAASGRELHRFPPLIENGHIVFSADGENVASNDAKNNRVRVQRVATGEIIREFAGNYWYTAALNGRGTRLIVQGYRDRIMRMWDIEAGKELVHFEGHRGLVTQMAISPDDKTFASASVGVEGEDRTLRLWDASTGKERWKWSIPPGLTYCRLAFSPDSRLLVAMTRHWNAVNGVGDPAEMYFFGVATGKVRSAEVDADALGSVAFAPDGRTLALGGGDGAVHICEMASGKERHVLHSRGGSVRSIAFSPDGQRISSVHDGEVLIWELPRSRRRLSSEETRAEWRALASDDAAAAYRAIQQLTGDPVRTLALLREEMHATPIPDGKLVQRLIKDLDENELAVREAAVRELKKLADVAEPMVREAIERGTSLEVRRRLELLLQTAQSWTPEQLRQERALEVLEKIGNADATHLLVALTRGAPEARLTREATAALARLHSAKK